MLIASTSHNPYRLQCPSSVECLAVVIVVAAVKVPGEVVMVAVRAVVLVTVAVVGVVLVLMPVVVVKRTFGSSSAAGRGRTRL